MIKRPLIKADYDLSTNWSITFANHVAKILDITSKEELISLIGRKSLTVVGVVPFGIRTMFAQLILSRLAELV